MKNPAFSSDETRWQAVAGRDRRAAGRFYYAVRTTGVVCEPGCGSRLPRRDNVLFFGSLPAALRAGFRPCRRCRPDDKAQSTGAPAAVLTACRVIAAAERPPSLRELGEAVGVSPGHLQRVFKKTLGVSPRDYADALRTERFREALQQDISVTDAVYAAGYGSASQAYESGGAGLGMTPGQFKDRGAGIDIDYAFADCRLGVVAVAATARGICAVELGDTRRGLAARLGERFASARRTDGAQPLTDWLQDVVAAIDERGEANRLPLDIQGTTFQLKVWQALRNVPAGETRSYADIARQIGRPRAARAVAAACAANPVAVLVPCHRIVRGDGSLSGYRWGVGRKQQLLDAEAEE